MFFLVFFLFWGNYPLSFILYHLARLGVRNYTQLVVLKNINLGNKKM